MNIEKQHYCLDLEPGKDYKTEDSYTFRIDWAYTEDPSGPHRFVSSNGIVKKGIRDPIPTKISIRGVGDFKLVKLTEEESK